MKYYHKKLVVKITVAMCSNSVKMLQFHRAGDGYLVAQ